MMWAKIISDDATIKDYCYEPLRSGATYKAEAFNKLYTRVFFSFDGEEHMLTVHNRHLQFIGIDEHREERLKSIGIKE
jgi:hypothetical protein